MNIPPTTAQIQEIERRLRLRLDFSLKTEPHSQKIIAISKSASSQEIEETGRYLFDLATKRRRFSPAIRRKMLPLADAYFKRCRSLSEEQKRCHEKVQARLLGEHLKASDIANPRLQKLIDANYLAYSAHQFKTPLTLKNGISLPINGEAIPFAEIEESVEGPRRRFSHQGKTLFKTALDYALSGYQFLPQRGIVKEKTPQLIETQHTGTNSHRLLVYNYLQDPLDPKIYGGHSFLAIESPDGARISCGIYRTLPSSDTRQCADPYALPPQRGLVKSPDQLLPYPKRRFSRQKVSFPISEEHYFVLRKQLQKDLQDGVWVSLTKGNCTAYVVKRMKMIGIRARGKMLITTFLALKVLSLLPRAWQKRLRLLKMPLPKRVCRILLFFPPYYLLHLLINIPLKLLSDSPRIPKPTYSWQALFLKPWKSTLYHPAALRSELKQASLV
jgi:hypothetical protein